MRSIVNDPSKVREDMLEGYLNANIDRIEQSRIQGVYSLKNKAKGKVGVVSGGGFGHMPAFIGYLREGLLDAVAVGEMFLAPDSEGFAQAIREADTGAGVICLYGNYPLDMANVEAAAKIVSAEGIKVKTLAICDEVASEKKRGLCGEAFLWKIAGAAAQNGKTLCEIEKLCKAACRNTYTIGIGLSACIIPEVGVPNFDVVEGTMEVGIGHHGEPGIETYKLKPADEMADIMLDKIFSEYSPRQGDSVAVMISGLGSTTSMEMYILYNRIHKVLIQKKINIEGVYIGNYFTSLNMAGVNLSVFKLDDETKKLLKQDEYLLDCI